MAASAHPSRRIARGHGLLRRKRTSGAVRGAVAHASGSTDRSPPWLMVNDASGKMGSAVVEAIARRDLPLVHKSLTGTSGGKQISAPHHVTLHCPNEIDAVQYLKDVKSSCDNNLIAIDFTVPDVVETMCELYVSAGVPFVLGTTGGDREWLAKRPEEAGVHAVVAPQMGKQVVALQAAMEQMASSFPGAFSGYSLDIVESHQPSKADTSGTAKSMVQSFNTLGVHPQVDESHVEKIRDEKQAIERMGVPEEFTSGHAFHTYTLTSPDENAQLQFKHNVCGRSIYAEGSVDAALFLAQQIASNSTKKTFSMIDCLRAGQMS